MFPFTRVLFWHVFFTHRLFGNFRPDERAVTFSPRCCSCRCVKGTASARTALLRPCPKTCVGQNTCVFVFAGMLNYSLPKFLDCKLFGRTILVVSRAFVEQVELLFSRLLAQSENGQRPERQEAEGLSDHGSGCRRAQFGVYVKGKKGAAAGLVMFHDLSL